MVVERDPFLLHPPTSSYSATLPPAGLATLFSLLHQLAACHAWNHDRVSSAILTQIFHGCRASTPGSRSHGNTRLPGFNQGMSTLSKIASSADVDVSGG